MAANDDEVRRKRRERIAERKATAAAARASSSNRGEFPAEDTIRDGETQSETASQAPHYLFEVEHAEPAKKNKKGDDSGETVNTPPDKLADFFLLIFNSLVARAYGPEARLNQIESNLIKPPMERMLKRLPKSSQERLGSLADPLSMMFGLGLWYLRVSDIRRRDTNARIEAQNGPDTRPQTEFRPTPPSPIPNGPTNGVTRTAPIGIDPNRPSNAVPFGIDITRDTSLIEEGM